MRRFLFSALSLSLLAGCSSYNFSLKPHRIDVQQGNALDQENVSRLKPGLNRSQVRFLLGTPLLVDPFHTDRWDYVYVYYKAGKLAEQKRISLFFDGETLVRIEGDLPSAEPVAQTPMPAPADKPKVKAEPAAAAEADRSPVPGNAPVAATVATATPEPAVTAAAQVKAPAPVPQAATPAAKPPVAVKAAQPAAAKPAPTAAAATTAAKAPSAPTAPAVTQTAPAVASPADPVTKPPAATRRPAMSTETSIVQPLPSPKGAPPYKDPHPAAELSLQPETDVAQIKPDVMPAFPEPAPAAPAAGTANDEAVLQALNAWVNAWSRRDDEAYFAAYDPGFIPQGGGSHAEWAKRKRMLLAVAQNIDVKIESPSVDFADDGSVTVTFNQFYRSDSYRDAVVKQLRMTERDGKWLIVDEKVLSILHGAKP